MLKELPDEIINIILLNYLSIYDNKNINQFIEYKRQKIIKLSIIKINKIIFKYIIIRRFDIEYFDDYAIPKYYWKYYYPLCERKLFIKLVMKQKNLNQSSEINIIYNYYLKNPKNNLTITFNKIIDLLTEIELFNIGW